jgi:hypothetical protein
VRPDVNALIVAAEDRHRKYLGLPPTPVGDALSVLAACYLCWSAVRAEMLDARKSIT